MRLLALILACPLLAASSQASPTETSDSALASRFAKLALDCVHKEYPNKISHVLNGDEDVLPPRKLTPAFYGCFDWHSAVHGHWLLARLARLHPQAAFAAPARAALARSLTAENIAGEVRYLNGKGRAAFERPYGLAWLLQLAAELREWNDPEARAWSRNLAPLEALSAGRISEWLPKLAYPIREGEHAQTAFAFGLILDWARSANQPQVAALVEKKANALHASDRSCPLNFEPSGQDFLSPCLAEADLMRRVLPPTVYAAWLGAFLPGLPMKDDAAWLEPGIVTDPTDGKLVHLHGLNLSRAWMLEGMATGLPEGDPRLPALRAAAARHRDAGIAGVSVSSYEGSHWLGTFATYLTTSRGLPTRPPSVLARPASSQGAPAPPEPARNVP